MQSTGLEGIRFRQHISPCAPLPRLLLFCQESKENARQLARDPQSSPALLGTLARHPDPLTREEVTKNPNTEPRVLFELGARHPRQLLQNPAFSLLLLSDPDILARLPSRAALGLLQLPCVPTLLLEYATRDPMEWVRQAAARHPLLPEHLRARLQQDSSPRVRKSALRRR